MLSLGAIGVLHNDQDAMQKAEQTLVCLRPDPPVDRSVSQVLTEIGRSQGQAVNDVSRTGIMLDPSSACAWSDLSRGCDVLARLALKLAQQDHTMDAEELSGCYEKSRSLDDVQSGILLSPWRIEGWLKLKAFSPER